MSKRSSDHGQQRREEAEAEDDAESEVAGVFSRADSSVVAQRKIVKVRRSGATNGGNSSLNPFAGTNALGTPAAAANPFAGFGGLSAATTPAVKSASTPAPKPAASVSGGITLPTFASLPSANMFAAKSTTTGKDTASASSTAGTGIGASVGTGSNESKIARLNQSFLVWLEKQSTQAPLGLWQEGCQDYIKSAQSIMASEGTGTGADASASASVGSAATKSNDKPESSSFSFGKTASSSATAATVGFTFGAAPAAVPAVTVKPADAPLPAFSFNTKSDATSTTTAPPAAFSFNIPPPVPAASSTTVPSSGGFSFGLPPAAPAAATVGGFSFGLPPAAPAGSVTTTATAIGGGGDNDNDNDDDEAEPILAPEKVLKNELDTDKVLFDLGDDSMKLMRFHPIDNEWKDVGKGSLRLTQEKDVPDGPVRILVRNSLGKITLNTNMFKGMKFEKTGKNGIKFMIIEADKKFVTVLVKVKPDKLDETMKAFNDHIPK